ncbi:2-oxo acid dehydrogenase subunit E2 [Mycoplasma sp. ES3157-GEN-MYC]|uniref:Dihydrolipoamide acetyltransferase n=1 Tax=Mycoplasma miroungigenitalium TaxID=754515 RepID=A0A6M4JEQ3_9MOLU|nr:2-oxo acid dehydrogenase subunit E2 [Mycoplasma miroungigenitalium]MBU4690467.1 2-oxo acid dehydrogenase subunit E2 [Mycoplasma miroungigenitalium]MBU4691734.1 2-oxo acid dehydrogenase subunit E2 [Mycoplasma miroungigenitalium]QJR43562.1 dihydrolipoamide acetyltransferase [Mycoplasma miroungigenitalium]
MSDMIQAKELVAKTEAITPIRKAIAKNLKQVVDNIAYCALTQKTDASALWNFRKQVVVSVQEKEGVKLTFLSWIIKATAIALTEFPAFAAKWDGEKGEVSYPETININIAVDTPYGLVVPVIRNVEKLSIVEIQKEIVRLAQLAQDKKLTMKDMSGGNFTVTNVGSMGVLFGSPIPNLGQTAILAVGSIVDGVKADKSGAFSLIKELYLTIAADHRWVDGGDMGRLNNRIMQLLQTPELLGEL